VLGWIARKTRVLYFEKLGSCRERTGEIDDGLSYNGSQPPSALLWMDSLSVAQYAEASYPSILATDY